jgi:hypothetical protein
MGLAVKKQQIQSQTGAEVARGVHLRLDLIKFPCRVRDEVVLRRDVLILELIRAV